MPRFLSLFHVGLVVFCGLNVLENKDQFVFTFSLYRVTRKIHHFTFLKIKEYFLTWRLYFRKPCITLRKGHPIANVLSYKWSLYENSTSNWRSCESGLDQVFKFFWIQIWFSNFWNLDPVFKLDPDPVSAPGSRSKKKVQKGSKSHILKENLNYDLRTFKWKGQQLLWNLFRIQPGPDWRNLKTRSGSRKIWKPDLGNTPDPDPKPWQAQD